VRKLLTPFLFLCILLLPSLSYGQDESKPASTATTTVTITASTSPEDLAKAAFNAQGGEKMRKVQNIVMRGSVDLYAPNSTQSIPGAFVIAIAGDKVRVEVDARPAISFKQIFDGQQSYSSIPGVELPPASKFGLGVLARYDQPGYKITAVPDKKKLRGFRISDPDGNATEFYVDPASGRVMSFLIGYNGYTFGTEHKKFKDVEGVLVATSFTQRLEMPQGAFFADYNVKDVKLNQQLGDDVFAIPN
jgi:hypothetical protein